jgi:uncharacterized protein (DUF58 family)
VKTSAETYTPDDQVVVSLRHLIDMQYKARGFRFASPHMFNSLMMGRHRSHMRGRGLDFEELRHYRVGDDIRNMDWKVTNRTRKPHVRVYTEERERQVIVVIDQRASMLFGSQRVMKSVAAAELGALAAWRTFDAGDRIGALIFSDNQITEIRPHRSRSQIMRTLSVLQEYNQSLLSGVAPSIADNQQANNTNQLNCVLNKLNALAGHDMQICLFTDLDGADKTSEQLMAALSQHNDVLLGFVYDPLESELPQGSAISSTISVSDGELQLDVNTRDQSLRTRYKAFFEQRLDRARQFLRGYGIPVLPFTTHEPVDTQLARMIEGA